MSISAEVQLETSERSNVLLLEFIDLEAFLTVKGLLLQEVFMTNTTFLRCIIDIGVTNSIDDMYIY